jgi:hypothetical protein
LATGLLITAFMVWLSLPLFVLAVTLSGAVDRDAASKQNAAESASRPQQKETRHASMKTQKFQRTQKATLTKESRLAFIRRAQVWMHTDIGSMDLRLGPQGPGAFPPDAAVTCDYVETAPSGSSRKFNCRIGEDDVVKVRYGAENGEVQGSVLASRLLWALGFGADRVYPVRVICRGCSSDPFTKPRRASAARVFEPAAIERQPEGREMKAGKEEGWAWPELALVDETAGGAPKAHRDALTLLAVLIQHTDNKAEQQRLLCLPGGLTEEGVCDKPFLALHDVGLTFGHANFANRSDTGSVNFLDWARTPIWRDAKACTGHLSRSNTGTLEDPPIHEAGRAFLAGLLLQLRDQQLHDLFDVSRVEWRSRQPNNSDALPGASVDEWVTVFKRKRDEIVASRCPA